MSLVILRSLLLSLLVGVGVVVVEVELELLLVEEGELDEEGVEL